MNTPIVSYVMSGGVGSRLWPLSRYDRPKQFHALDGEHSMLEQTLVRAGAIEGHMKNVHVIASAQHGPLISDSLKRLGIEANHALLEPMGRNTAAAVAIAALHTLDTSGDALVLIMPSDHAISPTLTFCETIRNGCEAAQDGAIVTYGIQPDRPETGYGYIQASTPGHGVCDVLRFVEKPDLVTAQHYLDEGGYYWNAGIFLFQASVMQAAFAQHAPDIWNMSRTAYQKLTHSEGHLLLPKDDYTKVPSTSVDYAIMEHFSSIAVVPSLFEWSDLGSWESLHAISTPDDSGNVKLGDVIEADCTNSYLRSEGPLLAATGLADAVVVATDDAVYACALSKSQDVRQIIEVLETGKRTSLYVTPDSNSSFLPGSQRRRVLDWLNEHAFELWAQEGVDRKHGGFHEVLDFEGKALSLDKRTRTMARQIYSFSKSIELGWKGPAHEIIEHGLDYLDRIEQSSGGWAKTANSRSKIIDPEIDTYDQAFVLFALAHASRTGSERARHMAERAFDFIEHELKHKSVGYRESVTGGTPRRANPHMHLLEAFLAWHQSSGDAQALSKAGAIVDLCHQRFFHAETWTLTEFFDDALNPLEGVDGDWTEPGHHFEWAALLIEYGRKTNTLESQWPIARRLYATAISQGINRRTGLCFDAVNRQGKPLKPTSRSWAQTEALRAVIALDGMAEHDLGNEVEARLGLLFSAHLEPVRKGLWLDCVDVSGQPKAANVPASIFYHLVNATSNYLNWTSERLAK